MMQSLGVEILDLGLIDYKLALLVQQEAFKAVRAGHLKSTLLICRHYPAITLGRQAAKSNILIPEAELKDKKISVYQVERGGDVTYHGPGQLVIYPVLNLADYKKDIHWFLRQCEETAINLLANFGVQGERIAGKTGVWVDGEKICSIGVAIRHWITFHGLSINIKKDDLVNFKLIRPCGMDIKMTSLETLVGRNIEINDIVGVLKGGNYDKSNFTRIGRGYH